MKKAYFIVTNLALVLASALFVERLRFYGPVCHGPLNPNEYFSGDNKRRFEEASQRYLANPSERDAILEQMRDLDVTAISVGEGEMRWIVRYRYAVNRVEYGYAPTKDFAARCGSCWEECADLGDGWYWRWIR